MAVAAHRISNEMCIVGTDEVFEHLEGTLVETGDDSANPAIRTAVLAHTETLLNFEDGLSEDQLRTRTPHFAVLTYEPVCPHCLRCYYPETGLSWRWARSFDWLGVCLQNPSAQIAVSDPRRLPYHGIG